MSSFAHDPLFSSASYPIRHLSLQKSLSLVYLPNVASSSFNLIPSTSRQGPMATFKDHRANSFANSTAAFNTKNPMTGHFGSLRGGNAYLTPGAPNVPHHFGDSNVSTLAGTIGGISINSQNFTPNKAGGPIPAGTPTDFSGGVPIPQHQSLWVQQHGQMLYPNGHLIHGTNQTNGIHNTPGIYSPVTPYIAPQNYSYGHQVVDHSPLANNWNGQGQVCGPEMPMLMTPRRDSASSVEQDVPATPYNGYGMYGNGVAIMDRSPSGIFSTATPSPSHLHPNGYAKPNTISTHLDFLLKQDPKIPRAIPAPNSPLKPLDRCLENRNGETNVYIRGLHPETADKMLEEWGKRFGDIQSSKSIIDMKTNLCKGFGFIKYYNFEDAENCIRGFHYLGYEVSFARESFYAKLKKFSDDHNTNLYVSNIPKNMNEHELGSVFIPFKVCSSRILRDSSGDGRGVGFARFESREICEKVIKQFNNTPVRKQGGEEYLIQIRYSDTHEQKLLKQQTAAGRQFRAAEYDLGVAQARGYIPAPAPEQGSPNEFEQFLRATQNYPQAVRYPRPYGQSTSAFRNWTMPRMMPMNRASGGSHVPYLKVNVAGVGQTDGETQPPEGHSLSGPSTPVKDASVMSNGSAFGPNGATDIHLSVEEHPSSDVSPTASHPIVGDLE